MKLSPRIALTAVLFLVVAAAAHAQVNYTSDANITDFTSKVTSYATFSNYSNNDGCGLPPFTPTSDELKTTGCRVYTGTLAGTGLSASNNWIKATFSSPVSTIVVFPNIDHFGQAYDGYQYQIAGSNDGVNWTLLYDPTSVTACESSCAASPNNGEPFTLGSSTGTPPTSVNNVLTPQSVGLPAGCSGTLSVPCAIGYIATFTFPTAYQYYAFGASTVAAGNNPSPNTDQELSAVGAKAPTSGVLLTITDPNTLIAAIYDSQIHTGNVVQAPCEDDPNFHTDAFVFQGSSWRGCDAGVPFETGQGSGTKTVGNFTFTTHYDSVSCNHNDTICASEGNPTGFLDVKNNGSPFAGTITLSGTPNINNPNCPAGPASDSITFTNESTLGGIPVTFALAQDSSNCGGWNADETLPLTAFLSTTFLFGNDDFVVTPTSINPGDVATFRPVPFPQSLFNVAAGSPFGSGQKCITYADFSSSNPLQPNGVCPEFQTHCLNNNVTCGDAESFAWQGQLDFIMDQNTILKLIGGVHFLGAPGVNCPQSIFASDTALSFTGTQPGLDAPPLKSGSHGGLNCFVPTYDPTAAPIPIGVTAKAFDGFKFLEDDNELNEVHPGFIVPLIWQQFDGAGGPKLTTLSLCKDGPTADPSVCSDAGVKAPWVFLSQIPFTCPGDPPTIFPPGPLKPSKFLGYLNLGNGFYVFNWQTPGVEGCTTVELQFSNGTAVFPARFELEK